MFQRIRLWSLQLKQQAMIVYCAMSDARTPFYWKIFCFLLISYAFSPIDLIPDFIPLLGYLDDFLIISCGVYLILKLLPSDIIASARVQANEMRVKPVSLFGLIIVIFIWIVFSLTLCYFLKR